MGVYLYSSFLEAGSPSVRRVSSASFRIAGGLRQIRKLVLGAEGNIGSYRFIGYGCAHAKSLGSRYFILDPVIALRFQLERQLFRARFHDAALVKHVHVVGNDIIEQSLVVCYHDNSV